MDSRVPLNASIPAPRAALTDVAFSPLPLSKLETPAEQSRMTDSLQQHVGKPLTTGVSILLLVRVSPTADKPLSSNHSMGVSPAHLKQHLVSEVADLMP